ncbi:hypothetical protein ACH5RR_027193 [Cinchona calisaya]|uniref:Subtilisin-like protease n=1 Tax=Cinchona calisaya TaxID=153742 RepID=A0ABD2Z4S3_9GENT
MNMATGKTCSVYIIHMDPLLIPKIFSNQSAWYTAVVNTAVAQNYPPSRSKLIYSYSNAIHGFSALLCPEELEAIKKSRGFLHSFKDRRVRMYTTHSPQFLGLSYHHGAWPASNFGEDVIIGVVDFGVWPESPSFAGKNMPDVPKRWRGECENSTAFNSSMCNKKLIGARYFSRGILADDPNSTIEMNSPRDIFGHGTHVSSIALGNYVDGAAYSSYGLGVARGIAPRARLAVYKVFFDNGTEHGINSCSDILAGIDQAIKDGVDILSFSIGEPGSLLYENPFAAATFSAAEKGIFVSMAASNNGPPYVPVANASKYYGALENDFPWVLTVGASTINREFQGTIILGNQESVTGLSLYAGKAIHDQVPIVYMNLCEELSQVQNFIVVCQQSKNSSTEALQTLVSHVNDRKSRGGVFITNHVDLGDIIETEFPALFVAPHDGKIIVDYIISSELPIAQMQFQQTCTGTKPAPKVASFSARGPSRDFPYVLKPDLIAPGERILGAWSQWDARSRKILGDFVLRSGTSMAAPHAAGVAALLKGAHPEWSPAAIRSAMITTADLWDTSQQHIKDTATGQAANPFALGSGHINPNKALDPGLVYDARKADYIAFLCALNYTLDQIRIITRSRTNCSLASQDINYPSFIAYFKKKGSTAWSTDARQTQVFRRTVTNVGDGRATYTALLTAPSGCSVTVMPDKLTFTNKFQKQSYNLSIEASTPLKDLVVYGYLRWVEIGGEHQVTSTIVATSLHL